MFFSEDEIPQISAALGPRRLFPFLSQMRLLFEGGACSGAALIRVNYGKERISRYMNCFT